MCIPVKDSYSDLLVPWLESGGNLIVSLPPPPPVHSLVPHRHRL